MTLECLVWAVFGHSHFVRQFLEKDKPQGGAETGRGHINVSGKGLVPLSWIHFRAPLTISHQLGPPSTILGTFFPSRRTRCL